MWLGHGCTEGSLLSQVKREARLERGSVGEHLPVVCKAWFQSQHTPHPKIEGAMLTRKEKIPPGPNHTRMEGGGPESLQAGSGASSVYLEIIQQKGMNQSNLTEVGD